MARVFITGSSDGLGLMAARLLIEQGHEVVVHGRNDLRRVDALRAASKAKGAVSGDLATIAGARSVAEQVNKLGRFDAVIHNAGVGYREPQRSETERGVPTVFAVNVLAPYILTALIERPDRLIYLSSGMHHSAAPRLDDLLWTKRPWSGSSAYAESKLCDVLLAFAVARRWPNVMSNALEPGWVPTKMGGASRAWRHEQGSSDASVARGQRRPAGAVERTIFLPPAASGAEPDHPRCEGSGSVHLRMRPDFRPHAPRMRALNQGRLMRIARDWSGELIADAAS